MHFEILEPPTSRGVWELYARTVADGLDSLSVRTQQATVTFYPREVAHSFDKSVRILGETPAPLGQRPTLVAVYIDSDREQAATLSLHEQD